VDYDGTYVYAACGDGMKIIDPDAAGGPEVLSTTEFASARDVLVVGTWAYVTNVDTSLLPVDVTDPANPVTYDVVTSGDDGYELHYHDGYLYVATFDHPRIFDLADPSVPVEVANFGATPGHDVNIVDDILFVAYWNDRKVSGYDFTDPSEPVFLDDWKSNSGYRGSNCLPFHGYIYFGTQSWGIEVIDYSDPYDLKEVGQIGTRGPDGMDTDGDFIYSAENGHGLKIFL